MDSSQIKSVRELSHLINSRNHAVVAREIQALTSSFDPYTATMDVAASILTDRDHFPYTRFFRTSPTATKPTIVEREAGFRPMTNACYRADDNFRKNDAYPSLCFQTPCSTVLLCHPRQSS